MPDTTPTPAAATPAGLPLSAEEIEKFRAQHTHLRQMLRADHARCMFCRLLAQLDAATARADAAADENEAHHDTLNELALKLQDWARDDDVAIDAILLDAADRGVAALAAAWADVDMERARANVGRAARIGMEALVQEQMAALAQERNRRRWAETRASHWRRQEDLVMIRLAQRSNELGRANLTHRTTLAQERQAREQAEQELETERAFHATHLRMIKRLSDQRDEIAGCFGALEALREQERARGERLVRRVTWIEDVVDEAIAAKIEAALDQWREAAPASPAAVPDATRLTHAIERAIAGLQEQPDIAQQTVVRWALVVLARALEGSEPADPTAATAAQAQGE